MDHMHLCEIPFNRLCTQNTGSIFLEELKQGCGSASVHINFVIESEGHAIGFLHKCFYFSYAARFLLRKLVARKCEDFESLGGIGLI